MNSQRIIKGKLFLAVLVTMLCGMVAGGCSDDKDELEGKQYGYVQFRLYKSSSYTQEEKTRTGIGIYPRLRDGQVDRRPKSGNRNAAQRYEHHPDARSERL